jgi:hypothetical protein
MNLFSMIGQIFKPAAELIDNVHTSEEERLEQKAQLLSLQTDFLQHALTYENEQLQTRARIVEAEAKSPHWLTSAWRPITMLTFLALVVADQFGVLAFRLNQEAWTLLQIGLGGYVVGRSVEKVVPSVTRAFKEREK